MPALLEILRPMNCIMAGIAAVIGLMIAGSPDLLDAALIFLAVFTVTGAGNAVNDYFDREIDAVNRPGRPIPSGRTSPRTALVWSLVLFISGSALAALVSTLCLAIAAFNSLLLYFYARNLKGTAFLGNLSVAYLTGSTFVFGGAALGIEGMEAALIPALLSGLATVAREIEKDVEDMAGDEKGGARTMPILIGSRPSHALAALFTAVSVALSFFVPLGRAYLAVVVFADIFLLAALGRIVKGDAGAAQKDLKIGIAVALAAFLAGALELA